MGSTDTESKDLTLEEPLHARGGGEEEESQEEEHRRPRVQRLLLLLLLALVLLLLVLTALPPHRHLHPASHWRRVDINIFIWIYNWSRYLVDIIYIVTYAQEEYPTDEVYGGHDGEGVAQVGQALAGVHTAELLHRGHVGHTCHTARWYH